MRRYGDAELRRKNDFEKIYLVGIKKHGMSVYEMQRSMHELESLVDTAGGKVVGRTHQDIKKIDPAFFIGKGKVQEIAETIKELGANVVILDDDISPIQNRNLERELKAFALDRTAVILDIFAMRARSKEGKLQVELAQLEYLAPRLVGRGEMFSQQTGRIGTRGPGETQLEYDRRNIKDRISYLKHQIEKVKKSRDIFRKKRESVPIPLVSVVGYTNAGKSTLMNLLTNAGVFVEDKLFATLDPTVRRLRLKSGREILFADTVGFIRKLPHQLVAAFKATFEEIEHADLLLEVVDISDEDYLKHRGVIEKVLTEMHLAKKPAIAVFNKCDKKDKYFIEENAVYISALKGTGINELLDQIDIILRRDFKKVKLVLPYKDGSVLSQIYKVGHVRKVEHNGESIIIDCELPVKYEKMYSEYIV